MKDLVHRPSPHEHLLKEHELIELGSGARRVCYRIGETGFCVKFLRDPTDGESDRRFGWKFRRMLRRDRFDRRRNVNCQEADAMARYRQAAGPAVAAALPEVVEIVFDERRGYGVLMSLVGNADGSPVICVHYEMMRQKSEAFSRACYRQLKTLLGDLIASSAPFFEPDNFVAEVLADGSPRIRIIDFEPCEKKLIPLGEYVPFVRRWNLRRKARAYLRRLVEVFGIEADC